MMALNISISWYRFCTTPRQQQPPQKGKIKIKTKAKARKLREKIRKIEKKLGEEEEGAWKFLEFNSNGGIWDC